MKVKSYLLSAGKLQEQPAEVHLESQIGVSGGTWFDVEDPAAEELSQFLAPLDLHPLQLARCLDPVGQPGVMYFGHSLLMEYPAPLDQESAMPAYLTILLQGPRLVTIRHGAMPALDALVCDLTAEAAPPVLHLSQLLYEMLDQFGDLNVEAQVRIRDQVLSLSNALAENPAAVKNSDLSRLRGQLGNLVALIENQLYCISGLNASDAELLRDPHRKAYIQDLQSETEIAQRGVYRLEARIKDLYDDYQAAGSERLDRRLRFLTIISAITLPLGLLAGLLGMNVGGVPGIGVRSGFLIVIALMALVLVAEYWYFKTKGWFD